MHEALILLAFVALAVAVAVVSVRSAWRGWPLLERTLESSSQLAVRLAVVLVFGLVALAGSLGLDVLLGGFVAGIITRLALKGREVEVLESKLTAVGFGFLIPFFFVSSGMNFDVDALGDPSTLREGADVRRALPARARHPGAAALPRRAGRRDRVALAFYSATELPLVVAITTIAVEQGHMRSSTAAALVGARSSRLRRSRSSAWHCAAAGLTGRRPKPRDAVDRLGYGGLMSKWAVLAVLGAAQFLMVLDQAVMNVAISQLVADFDTTVTTIQTVIALYALVMAALMVTGGKLGDLWGRRRAFSIGLVIYAFGSALTAASWSVPSLMLGWSILEGIGAALVMPALVALVAGNYQGQDRAVAYGVLGGVAGAGIAVGPILGGWATTELSWRVVFVGEVVVAAGILLGTRLIREPAREGRAPSLDWVGSVLTALGLALIVIGVLQASNWGWLKPQDSPIEPFGFSLTPFVIAAGGLVLAAFRAWERHREAQGRDPLIHFRLFQVPRLRGGLSMLLVQNLILMGIFFTIPLYLQIVQGLDALETGVRMLPASAGLFIAALAGSRLASRFAAAAAGARRPRDHAALDRDAPGRDRARGRHRPLPGCDGCAGGRHGPGHLPAWKRGPVGGRRCRPQRGGRAAEHRPAAGLLARHRAAWRGGDQRPDRVVQRQRGRRPAHSRRSEAAGRDQAWRRRELHRRR